MPIVQTDQLYVGGPFKRQVKFTKSDGFTCELPLVSHKILGITGTKSDTLQGCLRLWNDAIVKWKAASTTTREVLLYQVHRKAYICDKEDRRCLFDADDLHFEEGIGLTVCAAVFLETKIALGDDVRYEYDIIKNRLTASVEHGAGGHRGLVHGRGDIERGAIPTTPELEAFFTNIGNGLETLILMFDKLRDPNKVLELAALGVKTLPFQSTGKSLPEGS